MKLFALYIKQHYKSIVMFFVFSAVFTVVFYLYDLPLAAVAYAVLLCLAAGATIMLVSFFRFKERHDSFVRLQKVILFSLDELPNAKNTLERDYEELVRALFNEKSRIESEKAESLADMTDYYTLWVHQIKTPIAAMNLLLQSGDANIGEISEQLFRIEQYVGMVLTYLRCDFSENDYVIRRCELDGIIKGAVRKYAKSFIREKISLDYTETHCTVLTDEKWLAFVIEQLLSNALKYTKSGKISVYVRDGETLVIEDTGIGIAPEDLPRVCEKGYTGYNGRADKKSTGIGLYLCKRVLDGLSHRFTIESEVGKGTRVSIKLSTVSTIYE